MACLKNRHMGDEKNVQHISKKQPVAAVFSEPDSLPVATCITGCNIAVRCFPDELSGTEVHVVVSHLVDLMATCCQCRAHVSRHRVFKIEGQADIDFPARSIAGSLWLLAIGQHTHQRLHVTLRLHVAAHDAKAHLRLTIPGQKARNDSVEWSLAGRDAIDVTRAGVEAVTSILQADTGARYDDA